MCKDKLVKTGKKKSYYILRKGIAVSLFCILGLASVTIPVSLTIVDLTKAETKEVTNDQVDENVEEIETLHY